MTSHLFSQQAEFFKDSSAVHQPLFGRSPADPPPGPHCLSGHHDLETVRHENRLKIHADNLQVERGETDRTVQTDQILLDEVFPAFVQVVGTRLRLPV